MPLEYPPTRQDDTQDDFHGTLVADPFRWLEHTDTPENTEWTRSQNELTRQFLTSPVQGQASEKLKSLWNYPRLSVPQQFGDTLFFWRNSGLQAQAVLFKSQEGQESVLLDPNTLNTEGTTAVSTTYFHPEGTYLIYSLSEAGSDWQNVKIMDTQTGENLPETLSQTRFASVAWVPEKNGFYYTRFPTHGAEETPEDTQHHQIFWHTLGTPQSQDRFVYEHTQHSDLHMRIHSSDDHEHVIVYLHKGTDRRNRVYYFSPTDEAVKPLLSEPIAHFSCVGNSGSQFYFLTDHEAERFRLLGIDLNQPEETHWQEILPQSEDVLANVKWVGQHFVALYMHHAHHQLLIFDKTGHKTQAVELPTIGTVTALSAQPQDTAFYMGFTSYLFPTRIYHFDLTTHELELFHDTELAFDTKAFETRQFFCTSKDGTQVPFFMVSKKGIKADGSHPVWLYGYGGFRNALTPNFNPAWLPWIEQGGIFCVVNTRGGSEYGTEWYRAGTLERKQNVFDDFMAAGDWLIQENYTQPGKIAIQGGSNGGLLVATCMLQRPEILGAVLCQVPVIDMLRYHRFTIGRYWISDYGNADATPEEFAYMYKYSPLHNTQNAPECPPIMVLTGDHDDRVVPAHAKKFVATLQRDQHPLALLRVAYSAGHGHGKPTQKVIEEYSDIYAFLFKVLDLEWTA